MSEVAWFGALCDDDYQFLGVPEPELMSSWDHCRDIVLAAERGGFDNVLLPSGYTLGIDTVAFAAAVAPLTERISLLVAVRCGEAWPPQLARQLATLDHILRRSDRSGGDRSRLTINIISSDRPGETLESEPRYRRTLETMRILGDLLDGRAVSHRGEFYDVDVEPPRIAAGGSPRPPFYFGGLSPAARRVAAEAADVYLMWPDTEPAVEALVGEMTEAARAVDRTLRFGYRCHVIVRESESEARQAAAALVSRLDVAEGDAIRGRSLDAATFGVARQSELRGASDDDGFVEDHLWTGIGAGRSGCGAAVVGDPDQVLAKLRRYEDLGIDTFILSGYPHIAECDLFAEHVLPALRA